MKKHIMLTAGFVIATMAVVVATQSVNHVVAGSEVKGVKSKMVKTHRHYTSDDVGFLMKSNHWRREQAVEVLDLASLAAERRAVQYAGIEVKP